MFCNKCGASCADNASFCNTCGSPLKVAPQVPVQPAYQMPAQPAYQVPVAPAGYRPRLDAAEAVRKHIRLITVVVALLALTMFVLSTFSILDLPVTAKISGDELDEAYEMLEEEADISVNPNAVTTYLSAGEVADLVELAEDNDLFEMAEEEGVDIEISAVPLYIGNILFGVVNLVIAFLCLRSLLTYQGFLFAPCVAGIVGALLQVVVFLFAGMSESVEGVKLSLTFGVHWTTWLAVAIYAVVGAADLLTRSKEY